MNKLDRTGAVVQSEGELSEAAAASSPDPLKRRKTRRRSLRANLLLMMFSPVAPMIVLGALILVYQWHAQQDEVSASLIDRASVVSVAVERELSRSRVILETLAASDLIDAKDWRGFHRLASAAISNLPDFMIALTEPSGEQPVRTMRPFGAPTVNPLAIAQAGMAVEWNGHRLPLSTQGLSKRVFETAAISNSSLYLGVTSKKPAVAIGVPVMREGKVVAVLIGAFAVDGLVNVLREVSYADARIALIDASGRIIATNERPEQTIGSVNDEALPADSGAGMRGSFEARDLDNRATVAAYQRLDQVDWTVLVALRKTTARAPAVKSALIWSLLGLAFLGAGFYGARRFWLHVEPPLALLGQSAGAVQRGESIELPSSDIIEIDELAALLNAAAVTEKRERAEVTRRTVAEESARATRELVAALTKSELRFRLLFEHSCNGIASVDLNTGRFVLVNRRLCEITGYSEQELLALTVADITHPDYHAQYQLSMRLLASGESEGYDSEKRYIRKDGGLRWVQLQVRSFPGLAGLETFSFASISDISEKKEAELALKEADRRKDEFLATLAHELRNPLAPLRTGIEILNLRQDDPAIVAKVRTMMGRQVSHMVRLIDDLLDVSRIRTGQLHMQLARIDLAEVVGAAVETCRAAIDASGHEFVMNLRDTPLMIQGDSARLIQVIDNLLVNAVKYTDGRGRITVEAFRRDDRAIVIVRDTGIGIPPEKLELVFDMFAQVHGPRGTGKERGLGIGLHIVRRLVELHGGTVEAHSDGAGAGSEFVIALPFDCSEAAPVSAAALPTALPPVFPLDIVVVDDNREAAQTLAELLGMHGHRVRTAFSGADALAIVTAACPRVILLDLGMPEMDGYEVARRIRSLPLPVQPVIVAVSGWGQADDRARTLDVGFDHHLVKPVSATDLQHMLQAATAGLPGSFPA